MSFKEEVYRRMNKQRTKTDHNSSRIRAFGSGESFTDIAEEGGGGGRTLQKGGGGQFYASRL